MSQLYIFEGPDRVGKSTFANAFSQKLGCPLYHFGKPDIVQQGIQGYQYQYYPLVSKPGPMVLDRSWISGLFYDMFRRQTIPQFESAISINSKFDSVTIVYIHRVLTDNLIKDHQLEVCQGLGYGTLEERLIEHINWPYFLVSLISYFDANFDWLISNLKYINTQLEYLERVTSGKKVRPSNIEVSQRVLDFAKQQTKGSNLSVLWSKFDWEDLNSNRNLKLFGDIEGESKVFIRNLIS